MVPKNYYLQLLGIKVNRKIYQPTEIEAELDSGNVSIPESASWLPEYERQCEAFTGGKQEEHDDIVDALIYFIKTSKKYGGTNWNIYKQAFRM